MPPRVELLVSSLAFLKYLPVGLGRQEPAPGSRCFSGFVLKGRDMKRGCLSASTPGTGSHCLVSPGVSGQYAPVPTTPAGIGVWESSAATSRSTCGGGHLTGAGPSRDIHEPQTRAPAHCRLTCTWAGPVKCGAL